MNWIIERDDKGEPVRMWWARENARERALQKKLDQADRNNALPMPAMREWAKERGL